MKFPDWLGRKWQSTVRRFHIGWRLFLVYFNNHVISSCISSRIRMSWYRNAMKFVVGTRSSILPDFRVSEPAKLVIGDHTIVNNSCRFDNRRQIIVGNNVSVSYGVLILTLGHDMDSPDFAIQGGDVTVEDYAWLCARCMIMPNVRIGKGAVVLPGAVVTKDVEPFSVVGGVPAKFVRKRREDLNYQQIYWDPRVPMLG
jgi:acetyltransferase-like isoleucine patch superfamily enzyme